MASQEQEDGRADNAFPESGADDDEDYDSDSEGTSALALRRREASDDDEDHQEPNGISRRPRFYEEDAEDEGAAPVEEEEDYEDVVDGDRPAENEVEDDEEVSQHHREGITKNAGSNTEGTVKQSPAGSKVAEDKKDAEPFVVPTAGAFYMHDDRFRYNGGVRPRRTAGGRRLWEAKDEKPWVHDRFEELNLQEETHPAQSYRGRGGRGRGRGQGKGRGRGRDSGFMKSRSSRERVFVESLKPFAHRGSRRLQGLRRAKMDDYEYREDRSRVNRSFAASSQETATNSSSTQPVKTEPPKPMVKTEESPATAKKPSTGSTLNSASPPFYPTGQLALTGLLATASKSMQGIDEKLTVKDVQQVGRGTSTNATEMGVVGLTVTRQPSLPVTNANALVSRTTNVDNTSHGNFMRGPNTLQPQVLKTGSASMIQQQRAAKVDGGSHALVDQTLRSAASQQQTNRGVSLAEPLRAPQAQLQDSKQGQTTQRQVVQSPIVISPGAPAKATIDNKPASVSLGSTLASSGAGRGTQPTSLQAGRGSLMLSGAGSGSLANGLRNGGALAVVQFAGQPQAGLGVPAVGVALPGYASQPQFGFSNSEVTWVPILAGGGSLGSSYSSPYITVDGGSQAVYYTPQTSQPATFAIPAREVNGSKPSSSNLFKPVKRSDFANDEFGQRQSKPRRYSEMNFGQ